MSIYFKTMLLAAIGGIIIWVVILNPFESDNKPSDQMLVVGLQSEYPPFEFMDERGNIIGYDVDLARLIAEKMGRSLLIQDMEFEGIILSLKQARIDLIISGMDITPSRLKEIEMIPYRGDEAHAFSLLFWGAVPKGVQSLDDLAGLPNPTVSVQSGTTSEIILTNFPSIQAKSFQGSFSPLMDVKYGKSAANIVEGDVGEYLKMMHPEVNILSVPLPDDMAVLGFGIGMKKGNPLLQDVQHIIQELKASGQLQQLEQKWFKGGV